MAIIIPTIGVSAEQMRYYAGCIGWLFPEPHDKTTVLWFKAAIASAMIGIAIGIWMLRNDTVSGPYLRTVVGAFCGALSGGVAVVSVAAMYYGMKYLIT